MPKDKELADHERAHSGQPGMKPRHGANASRSNVHGRTFTWDELSGEVGGPAKNKSGWEHVKTHPNGTKEFRSDRGHLALETKAKDKGEADSKFAKHSEEYVEQMRGVDIDKD